LFSAGEINFTTGPGGLLVTGNSGSGLFRDVSGVIQALRGDHPPISVNTTGAGVTVNAASQFSTTGLARSDSLVFSGAPPGNLDRLQSGILSAIDSSKQERGSSDTPVTAAKTKVDSSKVCK